MPITNLSQYGYIKSPARTVATSNVTISSPGSSVGGATLSSGDANKRVLLAGQTSASENGLYDWNGAASAMTRAVDANVSAMFIPGFVVAVLDGTSAGAVYQYQGAASPTLGSTSLTFTRTNPAATTPTITVQEVDGSPSISATQIEFPNGTVTNPSGTIARYTPATPTITVRDIDGTPSIAATTIEFTNGTVTDQTGGVARVTISSGGSSNPWNPPNLTIPAAASFTWRNQGLFTATDSTSGIFVEYPGGSTDSIRGKDVAVGGTSSVVMGMQRWAFSGAARSFLYVYDGSGYKTVGLNASGNIITEAWSSATGYTGTVGNSVTVALNGTLFAVRFTYSGGTTASAVSFDGVNWYALATGISFTPTHYGFGGWSNGLNYFVVNHLYAS